MKNKFLTTFVCILIAIILAVGGAIGIALAVTNARSVVKCGSISVDEGTVRYFAAYYKMLYMRSLRAAGIHALDDESFWSSEMKDGRTYGEDYLDSFRDYLASLISAANVYLTYSIYTPEDKLRVAETCDEILVHKANGSVEEFNDKAEIFGFDFNDFQNAAALIYKARKAEEVIYGKNGENMKNHPDLCVEYLSEYTHVSLLFVELSEEMTELDLMMQNETIGKLKAAIEARENGGDMQISSTMFNEYLQKSDGDPAMHERGYYFHPSAQKTAEFASVLGEVVEKAFEMEIGDFAYVDCSVGVCFLYRTEVDPSAYRDETNQFFSDFYADAAMFHYADVIAEMVDDVVFKPAYDSISPLEIPIINEYYIREFK